MHNKQLRISHTMAIFVKFCPKIKVETRSHTAISKALSFGSLLIILTLGILLDIHFFLFHKQRGKFQPFRFFKGYCLTVAYFSEKNLDLVAYQKIFSMFFSISNEVIDCKLSSGSKELVF